MTISKTIAIALLILPVISHAAKAPLSPEEKKAQSSHIIKGKVLAVTSSVEKSTVERAFGIHRDRIFKITVLVESVAKGEGVAKGDEILVLAWRPSTRIPPLPGLQGHGGIPATGDHVTLFLRRLEKEDAYQPLLPNGIEAG